MIKKTLEQYKLEFEEFHKKIGEKEKIPISIVNEYEQLAKDCISDYPNDDLGYVEYGISVNKFIDISRNYEETQNKIELIANLTKNNSKYIKTEESLLTNYPCVGGYTDNEPVQNMIYIEPKKEYAYIYILCADLWIQDGYYTDAANDFEIAFSLGIDYKYYIQELNPHFNNIYIKNTFCLQNIAINDIKNCKEIYLLGENGVGKTLFLQTIIDGILKERYVAEIDYGGGETFPKDYLNLFAYGVSRFRTGLIKDDDFDNEGFGTLFNRNKLLIDVEWWLKDIQRKESLSKANTSILTTGQLKPSKISLKTITGLIKDVVNFDNSNDLNIAFDFQKDKFVFVEKETIIEFENIADGYRSVLIWLCDLLRRLIENQPYIEKLEDFYGVVLIDEIDMFLHPKWEYSIVKILREKLPNIQWFFTTHSPLLVLGASSDAVFYKLYKENGITQISEQWKCSEIDNMLANAILTSPLFDMETARMRTFDESNKEIDTSSNFWYSKIEKIIKQEKNEQKNKGKIYFSEADIQAIVSNAISKIKTELTND